VPPPPLKPDEQPPPLSAEWALVERVCASPHLLRSPRLRELLTFLCRRTLDEGAVEVREQEIGVAVFARHRHYDPAQETIVRVQASHLRKRVEKYFAEEGRDEPLVLEIPKGSYLPVFRPRALEVSAAAPEPGPAPRRSPLAPGLTAACVFLALLCIWLLGNGRLFSTSQTPQLDRFWKWFTANGHETYLVLADSALSAVQDATGHDIGIDEYVKRGYTESIASSRLSPDARMLLQYLMRRRYTSVADANVVRRMTSVRAMDPERLSIVFSREHSLRLFQTSNHILIGSQRAVPWVNLFADNMDFHLVFEGLENTAIVINRHPKGNEQARYLAPPPGPDGAEGYSLVAVVPNLGHTGKVLILAGSEMSGTEMAGSIVTTEALIAEMLGRFATQRDGSIPFFEALLKIRYVEHTARGFEILALHIH
jgi:hypothetical protein